MEDFGKLAPYRRNRQIKIFDKLKFIDISKRKGNGVAVRLAGVTTKSIRLWRQNEIKFKQLQIPNELITLHKGNPNWTINEDFDKSIYDWIDFNRSLGNCITTWGIGVEMIKRNPNLKELKLRTLQKRVERFLKRNNLSIRTASHIWQILPESSIDLVFNFLKEIIHIRKDYNIPKENIINMDEVAIQMNMPSNKTVHKVGAKTIVINTQRQEKLRVSVILSFSDSGEKLKPFVIFKDKKYGNIYKNLIREDLIKKNKVEIFVNENAWATKEIIIIWIKKYIFHLLKKIIWIDHF